MGAVGGAGNDDITMQTGPRGYVEPTFGQRLVARIVDAFVLLPAVVAVSLATDGRLRVGLVLAASAVYETVCVSRWGRTVGKQLLGTCVVDATYATYLGPGRAAMRWFGLFGGGLAGLVHPAWANLAELWLLIAVVPVLLPPLHRGLHDRAAGSIVTGDSASVLN
jgi:uncharacterized RDD family membrane protein YckC